MAGNKFAPSGIKGFFAFHVEKVVLGVCVALVALFFCLGWGVPRMPDEQTPQELFKRLKEGEKHIAVKTVWEELGPTRAIEANHLDRAVRSRKPVVESPYKIPVVWKLGDVPLNEKRTDPVLYPPERVFAHAFVTGLVTPRAAGVADAWTGLPNAELAVAAPPPEKEPEKKKEPRRRRRKDPDDPLALEEDLDDPLDEPDDPVDDPVDDPLGGEGEFVPAGQARMLSAAQLNDLLQGGWRHVAGDGSVTGATIVAVTAVVPYRKQLAEYDRCFDSAMGYDPQRDRPDYFHFQAWRAEAPETGPVDEASLKWEFVTDSTKEKKNSAYWSFANLEEVVDAKHLHPALSSRIPPAQFVNAFKFAGHPDVAFRTPEQIEQDKRTKEAPKDTRDDGSPMDPTSGGVPSVPSGIPSPVTGGPSDVPPPIDAVDPAGPDDAVDPVDLPPEDEFGVDEGIDGDEISSTTEKKPEEEAVDTLLIRFYDYKAERGKSYVYRVKVFLRDPNNPAPPPPGAARPGEEGQTSVGDYSPPVPDRMLADEALDRVRANRAKKQYYIETEFSAPSPVVHVPTLPIKLLAGDVNAARVSTLPGGARMTRDVDKANVLAVVWDNRLGANVPGLIEAARGTLLNFKATADILYPLTYALKRYQNYDFKTGALVVDMRGGETIGKSQILTPGEVLLVDKDGQLIVRNEFDPKNVESYRRQLFIEDHNPSQGGSAAPNGDYNPLNPLDGGKSPLD